MKKWPSHLTRKLWGRAGSRDLGQEFSRDGRRRGNRARKFLHWESKFEMGATKLALREGGVGGGATSTLSARWEGVTRKVLVTGMGNGQRDEVWRVSRRECVAGEMPPLEEWAEIKQREPWG